MWVMHLDVDDLSCSPNAPAKRSTSRCCSRLGEHKPPMLLSHAAGLVGRCSQLMPAQQENDDEAGDTTHGKQRQKAAESGAQRQKKQAGQHLDPAKAVRSAAKARVRTVWCCTLARRGFRVQVVTASYHSRAPELMGAPPCGRWWRSCTPCSSLRLPLAPSLPG